MYYVSKRALVVTNIKHGKRLLIRLTEDEADRLVGWILVVNAPHFFISSFLFDLLDNFADVFKYICLAPLPVDGLDLVAVLVQNGLGLRVEGGKALCNRVLWEN
jgi:hypothetical protein